MTFEAKTDSTFVFFVKYKFGNEFANVSSDDFKVSVVDVDDDRYIGYVKVEVTNIKSAGRIAVASQLSKFVLKFEVISYDSEQNVVEVEQNRVVANGNVCTEIEVNYGDKVILEYQTSGLYSFAGWSKDGEIRFSYESPLEYQVLQDQTIYAIFSALRYRVSLSTLEYSLIYTEYNDPAKTQAQFKELNDGPYYMDGEEIDSFEIYYGTDVTIGFTVPDGYMYYGYACKIGDEYQILKRENKPGSSIEVVISSRDFGNVAIDKIYLLVTSYSLTFDVETKINIDGVILDDEDVGSVKLSDNAGNDVNKYGYVDGTRIAYARHDSERSFSVVAYTADEVYLKISMAREGYQFVSARANRDDVEVALFKETPDFLLYRVK